MDFIYDESFQKWTQRSCQIDLNAKGIDGCTPFRLGKWTQLSHKMRLFQWYFKHCELSEYWFAILPSFLCYNRRSVEKVLKEVNRKNAKVCGTVKRKKNFGQRKFECTVTTA